MFDVSFWILAIVSVGTALGVLFIRSLFRAALLLAICFFTVAGIYVALQADFLAVAQVLIYLGAITILLVLAIMLTRDMRQANAPNRMRIAAFVVSALLLGVMVFAITGTPWKMDNSVPVSPTTGPLGTMLFAENGYLLPVEIAAGLLLASIVGAVVLMREK